MVSPGIVIQRLEGWRIATRVLKSPTSTARVYSSSIMAKPMIVTTIRVSSKPAIITGSGLGKRLRTSSLILNEVADW